MWFIIPKNSNQELHQLWGLQANQDRCVINGQWKNVIHDAKEYAALADKSDSCAAFVLNIALPSRPAIPDSLLQKIDKVFVHFGSTNRRDWTPEWIATEWQKIQKDLNLPDGLKDKKVLPMSPTSDWVGKSDLMDFAQSCPPNIDYLENAWNKLWNELHGCNGPGSRGGRSLLELHHFYIDVSAFLNHLNPRNPLVQDDLINSLRAFKEAFEERSKQVTSSLPTIPEAD